MYESLRTPAGRETKFLQMFLQKNIWARAGRAKFTTPGGALSSTEPGLSSHGCSTEEQHCQEAALEHVGAAQSCQWTELTLHLFHHHGSVVIGRSVAIGYKHRAHARMLSMG